ncbi:hypothetical protein GCM10009092_20860 [Bowmanella denitrificans]|uniref:Methyl-accepting chemotaxis protein n=2 Tax=Bowmanella denitrificans TaxID=366582 RepID=A0ABN0X6Q4_9ALTE
MKALKWINDLSISMKMLGVGLLVVVGVSLPTYMLLETSYAAQEAAEAELAGTHPADSALDLMRNIAMHRNLSTRIIQGEGQLHAEMLSRRTQVSNNLDKLANQMQGVSTTSIDPLKQSWQQTLALVDRNEAVKTVFDAHSQNIAETRKLLYAVMRESGMAYDPEPVSYHLIIANYEVLPRLVEVLAQIRGVGSKALSAGTAVEADKIAMVSAMDQLQTPLENYIDNLSEAGKYDRSLDGYLSSARQLQERIGALLQLSRREVVEKTSLDYSSERFTADFNQVLAGFYEQGDKLSSELNQLIAKRIDRLANERLGSITGLLVFFLLAAIAAFYLVRELIKAINRAISAASAIANGQFDTELDNARRDEIGKLNHALVEMTEKLREAARLATESMRVKQALDGATTNVMIADTERKIIYMNKSVEAMLRGVEPELKKALPGFAVDKIINGSMDGFHKNPAHQASLLENLKSTYQTEIKVGNLHFRLTANPIVAPDGKRLGSVVEWLDRTQEVLAEQEVTRIVSAASRGEFSDRIEVQDKSGFMLTIAEGINSLLTITDTGLKDIAKVLMAIADGDLTQRIDSEYQGTFDALKNYCNDTSDKLTDMIGQIREAADTISSASSEIAKGNSDLSSRTEQQAASLEETASSMEELTSTVRLNADNAKQANGLASQAATVATDGGSLIQQVVNTMASINESAQKISDIIGVIDGIAFQTNILALNAAVEAARAGEQGRGFAVVASEVRTLAQRSANAAKDIKTLISDSVAKIENGNQLVNQSGETMKEIVTSIKRVNDIMSEIAAASAEQSSGIDEIGKAVTQMDEMTQQNAALVEEAAAASESLQGQAQQLARQVATFKLDQQHQVASLPPAKPKVQAVRLTKENRKSKPTMAKVAVEEDEWESF